MCFSFQPIMCKTKANCEPGLQQFPALGTGCKVYCEGRCDWLVITFIFAGRVMFLFVPNAALCEIVSLTIVIFTTTSKEWKTFFFLLIHPFIFHLVQNLRKLGPILPFQTSLAEDLAASQIWYKGYAVWFLLQRSCRLKQQTWSKRNLTFNVYVVIIVPYFFSASKVDNHSVFRFARHISHSSY